MKNLDEFDVIAVKDKNDVLKAAELLGKIGISIFKSDESKDKYMKTGSDAKNNFLIKGVDGWRIQSHFIGNGISIEELELKINSIPFVISNSRNIKKFKVLRKKDTKEFVALHIQDNSTIIFTSELPEPLANTATIETIKEYYKEYSYSVITDVNFENFELIEYDLIESGVVGADIRNKLSPPLNLVSMLEVFFNKLNDHECDLDQINGLIPLIKKEMQQTKESVKYLSELL